MPHDYSPKQKAFFSRGRKVSHSAVRAEIDGLTDHVAKESARIAKRFVAGQITSVEFELQMRELLKPAHIVAASVGKGGRARMTQSDWGRVGSKIKWQYSYLQKFIRKAPRLSDASIASRARSYSSAIYTSFARTFKEAQTEFVAEGKNPIKARLVTNSAEGCAECAADESLGWMDVEDLGEIGTRECGDFCKCDIEFEDDLNLDDDNIKIKVTVGE